MIGQNEVNIQTSLLLQTQSKCENNYGIAEMPLLWIFLGCGGGTFNRWLLQNNKTK